MWTPPDPKSARVRFAPAVAVVTVLYVVTMALLWYHFRGTSFGSKRAVPPIFWGGAVVFLSALWVFRGVPPWRLRGETLIVIFSAWTFLTIYWYFGRGGSYVYWFGHKEPRGQPSALYEYYFFVSCGVFFRMVLPLLTGFFVLRRRPREFGYQLFGTFKLWWVYVLLLLAVLPFVVHASSLPAFVRKYPLCRNAINGGTIGTGTFLLYTGFSALLFASGESFWRGYILFGTERELGYLALFIMLVPYVTGHFGKPLPEAMGAIVTALVLGFLALRHASFWLGAVCHFLVALSMDLLALHHRGVHFV